MKGDDFGPHAPSAELGPDLIRMTSPVLQGNTLYAASKVLEMIGSASEEACIVQLQHPFFNHLNERRTSGERHVVGKCRSHWSNQ